MNPEAHDNYLMGMYQWNKATTGPELETAIRYFELATKRSGFMPGHTWASPMAYRDLGHLANVGGRPSNETLPGQGSGAESTETSIRHWAKPILLLQRSLLESVGLAGSRERIREAQRRGPAPITAGGHAWYGGYPGESGEKR